MAFSSDNCMQFVKQSLPPNYLTVVSVARPVIRKTKTKTEGKWSREHGQSSNSLVEIQTTGFAVQKTQGSLCSDLYITMETDCKQVSNHFVFQRKP